MWLTASLVYVLAARIVMRAAADDEGGCPPKVTWRSHIDDETFAATRGTLGCFEDCPPCLEGLEWDALRRTKGLTDVVRGAPVVIEFGNWLSSQAQSAVARIIVEEMLGYAVEMLPRADDDGAFPRLASGATTLNPEIWSHLSHKLPDFTEYVVDRECVRTSFTGVTAFEKLYAPSYAADDVCSTLAMDILRKDRASFADPDGTTNITAEVLEQCATENWPVSECTGGRWVPPQCATRDGGPSPWCSELLLGSPNWGQSWFEAVIVNLGLNFTTVYLPDLEAEIRRRYAARENFLFYWFAPDPLLTEIAATPLELPPWSEDCAFTYSEEPLESGVDCAIQQDTLLRGLHRATADAEPDLAEFSETFIWRPGDLDALMAEARASTVRDAACAWVRNNADQWANAVGHAAAPGGGNGGGGGGHDQDILFGFQAVAFAVIGFIVCFLVWRAYTTCRGYWRRLHGAREELEKKRLERLQRAVDAVHTCEHPMVVLSLADLAARGRLPPHEAVRGELVFLEDYDEVVAFARENSILFVSHQWLSFSEPDPDGAHFDAVCRAGELIARRGRLAPEDLYVWIDYSSVPQRNSTSQANACASLAVYANASRYFVAVCPEAVHKDTGRAVGPATYLARGWCRLEMWAMMSKPGGASAMFTYDGQLRPIAGRRDWYDAALRVFGGRFSREGDKVKIVDTVLGLYARALHHARLGDASPRSPSEGSRPSDADSEAPATVTASSRASPHRRLYRRSSSLQGAMERSFSSVRANALGAGAQRPGAEQPAWRKWFGDPAPDREGRHFADPGVVRETVFPEEYFGDLIGALEQHLAYGEIAWPDGYL